MTSARLEFATFDALEAAWSVDGADRTGQVHVLVARLGGGAHRTLPLAEFCPQRGLIGDRWERGQAPCLGRQVTVMDVRVAELVCAGQELYLPGDNILVDLNLSEDHLGVGDELRCGGLCLRVTEKPHLGCQVFAERLGAEALKWVNWRAHRDRRLRGVNCQVVAGGTLRVGDRLEGPGSSM